MSIIIYHQEPQIDPEQIDALHKFYGNKHLVVGTDWDYITIPDDTTIICRMEDDLVAHYEQPERFIDINTAFLAIINHVINNINPPGHHYYEPKLRQFLALQCGEIFTIDDVVMFLGYSQDSDGTFYVIPSLINTLERLGCSKERITIFTPPPQRDPTATPPPQPIKQRLVSRDEIYT